MIGTYVHSGNGDKWVLERRPDGVYHSFHKGGKERTSGGFYGKVSDDEAKNKLSQSINRMGSSYAMKTSLQEAMSVPQQHQFKIAKKTLKMSDAGANIMGGMSKKEARDFLKRVAGWSDARIKKYEDE